MVEGEEEREKGEKWEKGGKKKGGWEGWKKRRGKRKGGREGRMEGVVTLLTRQTIKKTVCRRSKFLDGGGTCCA